MLHSLERMKDVDGLPKSVEHQSQKLSDIPVLCLCV